MPDRNKVFLQIMVHNFVPVIPGVDGAAVPTVEEVGVGLPVRGGSDLETIRVVPPTESDEVHGSGEVPKES